MLTGKRPGKLVDPRPAPVGLRRGKSREQDLGSVGRRTQRLPTALRIVDLCLRVNVIKVDEARAGTAESGGGTIITEPDHIETAFPYAGREWSEVSIIANPSYS